MKTLILFISLLLLSSFPCEASGLDGAGMSFAWAVPFCGILLSLAIMPLILPSFWHKHFGKVAFVWALVTLIMITAKFGVMATIGEVLDTYLHHFIPFIIFIFSLYVIAGGIKIDILTKANPYFNTFYLAVTTFIASWIGTTGAAMLFIKPFLHVNQGRQNKRHLVIFFIFLVCNIGGSLTAVGDPPLFLGFLNGIDFFWPTTHLFGPFLTVSVPLLMMFYVMDTHQFKKEGMDYKTNEEDDRFIVKLGGRRNFLYLLMAVAAIIFSGIWETDLGITVYKTNLRAPDLMRDVILVILALLSLSKGNKRVRQENKFSWEPFMEVFKVFAAIFITAAPVIAMLKVGDAGAFSSLVALVNTDQGPNNMLYFWITGGLSSVLDNAPTYLVFFNLAGGDPLSLMTTQAKTLLAVSAGSVFMGAMTYIGNAPNFMIKAIAEKENIAMPSFFGYILWSCAILLPVFILVSFLWI